VRPLQTRKIAPVNTTSACSVIVVLETDRLMKLANAAVRRMGDRLKRVREVKLDARRFAERIARNPKSLEVQVYEVVGFCNPVKDRPDLLEPIVLCDGHAQPVTATYVGVAGDHHVVLSSKLDEIRDTFIANSARKLAHELFLVEAMSEAIFAADPNSTLRGMSFDVEKLAVGLDGDEDGQIARRLPKWITVESATVRPGR
jgi:hypothetical protein